MCISALYSKVLHNNRIQLQGVPFTEDRLDFWGFFSLHKLDCAGLKNIFFEISFFDSLFKHAEFLNISLLRQINLQPCFQTVSCAPVFQS